MVVQTEDEEGCNQQKVDKWKSWPAMGGIEPVTFKLEYRDIDRASAAGLWMDNPGSWVD